MSSVIPGSVVVGVDFSKANQSAIEYAAGLASRHHLPLHLLHAEDPHTSNAVVFLSMTVPEIQAEAEAELAGHVVALQQDYPDLAISRSFAPQSPADALVEAGKTAGMLVLGSRGLGGFGQLMLGSVAWRVASRASGPVVLVRPAEASAPSADGPVLVGLDGSDASKAALQFAVAEAAARGCALVAVNVWDWLQPGGLALSRDWPQAPAEWRADAQADAERVLSEALAGVSAQHPDVEVRRVTIHSLNVSDGLMDIAAREHADLVVVGARGRRPLPSLALGAVGVQLSHHADQAVAVVHA